MGGTLPEEADSGGAPGGSHITRLLRAVRSCRRADGPASATSAVQAAMSVAFAGAADGRGVPMGKRGVGRLSSPPPRGSTGNDFFLPTASGPPLAKRQAVGEPGTSSPLLKPLYSDDDSLRPAYSSSAASVQPFTAVGTLGRAGERGMDVVEEAAGEGAGVSNGPAAGAPDSRLLGGARDRDRESPSRVTRGGEGDSVESGGGCSRSLLGGAASSAGEGRRDTALIGVGEGTSVAQSLSELLEHYPETRQALESYRGNKLGAQVRCNTGYWYNKFTTNKILHLLDKYICKAHECLLCSLPLLIMQLQSLTPLTILNQHANRMKVEVRMHRFPSWRQSVPLRFLSQHIVHRFPPQVSFMERAETPTGPFTVQAKICVPGSPPDSCILGSGKVCHWRHS